MSSRNLFLKSHSPLKSRRLVLFVVVLVGVGYIMISPRERRLEEWTWQAPVEPPGVTIVSHQPQVVGAEKQLPLGVPSQSTSSAVQSSSAELAQTSMTAAAMTPNDQAQIRKVLELWSLAWSSRNMSAYFDQYATEFVPAGGQSRSSWEKARRQRILSKSQIIHEIRDLQITLEQDKATAKFEQMYATDQTRLVGPKTLRLQREGLNWRIISESSN